MEVAAAENGQFLTARVYVGNYGFTSAEMVTIRCTVNGKRLIFLQYQPWAREK